MSIAWSSVLAFMFTTLAGVPAAAQDFWQGRTLTLLVGAPTGSDHDKLGKLVARHLSEHIPGKPPINIDNRSSNNGVDALNDFYNSAPKDGSALHLLMPGMALLQALGAPGVRYDAEKLAYLGNLSRAPQVLATWWVTGFKTIDDGRRREMNLGAMGNSSLAAIYPTLLNTLLRTRFKPVTNYRREADMDNGIENVEIGGRIASWGSLLVNQPGWIAQKRLAILTQISLTRHKDLPDAPLLAELAGNDRDRAVMSFVSRDAEHARALAAPADVPADRLATLRRAFEAMSTDAAFLNEAQAGRHDIGVSNAAATSQAIRDELFAPRELIERVRTMVEGHF